MHLNKLSTAAMMRLSLLAALNLMMGRLLDGWLLILHPLFFFTVVTLDLGLYAVLVYSGTLNRALIAMMLTGLSIVLAAIAYAGAGPSAFVYGGRFGELADAVEWTVNRILALYDQPDGTTTRFFFEWRSRQTIGYLVADLIGAIAIVGVGLVSWIRRSRSRRRHRPASSPHPGSGPPE